MSIDSIKPKPRNKSPKPPRKEKAKPKKLSRMTPATNQDNRKKMWVLTIVSLVFIIGLWLVTLKLNIERINKKHAANETTNELSNIKSRFNDIFKQTSQLVDSLSPNTSTIPDITDTEKPTTTPADLSEEQIKELSDKIKNIIPTSTSNNTQL